MSRDLFGVLDCNNFFAGCQIALEPWLENKPVCVIGNNDGAIIARNQHAKKLGIKMGQPYFEVRHFEKKYGVIFFSANYSLYSDMSSRVLSIASALGPVSTAYSCDEIFFSQLQGIRNLNARAWTIRRRIQASVGITTCIGFAPSLTLAKLCDLVSKEAERTPGSYPAEYGGVCNWEDLTEVQREEMLAATPVKEVWGVGRKYAKRLNEMNVETALDLTRYPIATLRKIFGVSLERTVRELQGLSCIELDDTPTSQQQIACTRSFGAPITELDHLIDACTEFACKAAVRLRQLGQRTGAVQVFAHTSPFRPGPRFCEAACIRFPLPTSDTNEIVAAVVTGVRRFYKPNYRLSKAGVMLLDLQPKGWEQSDLLCNDTRAGNRGALMETMDEINARYGIGTLRIAQANGLDAVRPWRMKQHRRSPNYTTDLADIPIAHAN